MSESKTSSRLEWCIFLVIWGTVIVCALMSYAAFGQDRGPREILPTLAAGDDVSPGRVERSFDNDNDAD